ncbi:unnamed protein product [Haemonchus placei]|uniref:Mobile element protein n=1 Tax=Haemonchus placei TaxID=6290 RepID=A0A0N4VSV1_HAEPC|nr:unnamed protein product [Haemonchus placei]
MSDVTASKRGIPVMEVVVSFLYCLIQLSCTGQHYTVLRKVFKLSPNFER